MAKWFTYIQFEEGSTKSLLDSLIYICNPNEKHISHFTIQGPLDSRSPVDELKKELVGTSVPVLGPGRFFDNGQNTVFLNCGNHLMRKVWKKPHFKRIFPHITIYDGDDREFAIRLYEILKEHRPFLEFRVADVTCEESTKDQGSFHHMMELDLKPAANLISTTLNHYSIRELDPSERLALVEAICPKFVENSSTVSTIN